MILFATKSDGRGKKGREMETGKYVRGRLIGEKPATVLLSRF